MSTALVEIVTNAVQELVEAELTAFIGAEPGERTDTRTNQRNGHRPKLVSTPAGDLELKIPKLRQGSFYPELLEPRRRIDKALWAVSKAVVIATGLRADGHREVPGVDVGDPENETFWTEFLRDLRERGLSGVRLGDLRRPRRLEGGRGREVPARCLHRRERTLAA